MDAPGRSESRTVFKECFLVFVCTLHCKSATLKLLECEAFYRRSSLAVRIVSINFPVTRAANKTLTHNSCSSREKQRMWLAAHAVNLKFSVSLCAVLKKQRTKNVGFPHSSNELPSLWETLLHHHAASLFSQSCDAAFLSTFAVLHTSQAQMTVTMVGLKF